MKRYITLLFAALALCSCNKTTEPTEPLIDVTPTTIAGLWMLESYENGKALSEGSYVYIEFERSDRSYTLYQNIGSMFEQVKRGNYFIDTDSELGAVIRGNYGTEDYNYFDWNSRYIVEMTANKMRWTATHDSNDISVYVRVESRE